MIRFCDREICSIFYEDLNRQQILNYFLMNNYDEVICIADEEGRYKGLITYYSLICSENIYDAVSESFVRLDKNIWKNAGKFFSHYKGTYGEYPLLPVLDQAGYLICFAYDSDGNRELRMLRELLENQAALQFSHIFPQYKCVKIYGFNELAYFFVLYLEKLGVPVQTFGEMWNVINEKRDYELPDYKCMHIRAEGICKKKRNWKEYLLESVAVEFECIDNIYETNIKKGIIKNALFESNDFLDKLKYEKEIVIIGTGTESLDACDFLLENGISIIAFMDNRCEECNHKLFGKDILMPHDVRNSYKNPVFIQCTEKNSAWGIGGVDYYDYIGYRRNIQYFLLKDYFEVSSKGLPVLLKQNKIVLIGNKFLCNRLYVSLIEKDVEVLGYIDLMNTKNAGFQNMPQIQTYTDTAVCLIVLPDYFGAKTKRHTEIRNDIMSSLKNNGIQNYSDYFSHMSSLIPLEEKCATRTLLPAIWSPKKVILGSILGCSGSIFLGGLLDNHPSIIMMADCFLSRQLFWICSCLSVEKPSAILEKFWILYESEGGEQLHNILAFNEKLKQLLSGRNNCSSQELFVMFHIAYMNMYGLDVTDVQDKVIYWEPHMVWPGVLEECVRWLGGIYCCDIINVVRNICMKIGSFMKGDILMGWSKDRTLLYSYVLDYSIKNEDYNKYNRLVIKFEDLKLNPERELRKICERWNISWSDTLLCTTCHGEKDTYNNGEYIVSDFDLRPVFNTYGEYLSEFDLFRIMLINAVWQKKYNYPCSEISQFSMRELQEIFFHSFHFERFIKFESESAELNFKIRLQSRIRQRLQEVRMADLYY